MFLLQSLLDERVAEAQDNEGGRQLRLLHMSSIPDTLYMVDDKNYTAYCVNSAANTAPASVDIIAGTIPGT